MEVIAKIVNGLKPLTTFAISSISDVRLGPEYIPDFAHWYDFAHW